ncbi:MAG: hypothetical protein M1813_009838 [Trichoglossum hirsutum]|nr:MAG: hypothetical protein M1813_009838 [Trichoglossum hirsutum]
MARHQHRQHQHHHTTAAAVLPTPPPPPPLLRARAGAATGSICSECSTIALSAASCSDDSDYMCSCVTTAYGAQLSSCLSSVGCVASSWAYASSSISASCSYWTESLGSSLCGACTSSAINSLGCIDYDDYGCLCGGPDATGSGAGYAAVFSTCVAKTGSFGASCPFKTSTSIVSSHSASCSSYASSTSAYPIGCPSCQAAAADQMSCSGRFDYKCICSKSSYLPALQSCISAGRCSSTDFSVARSTYTEACSVVATGGTPSTAAAARATAKSGSAVPSQTGAAATNGTSHGPRITVIAGAIGGVVFLLAALIVGGYFIFRRKRTAGGKAGQPDLVPLQPTANNNHSASPPPPDYKAHEADGVAVPGHPGYVPPPPPPNHYEAASTPVVGHAPEWQAQGYMMNKPARGPYAELADGQQVPPPTPPQQPYHSPYFQQQQQQQYYSPMPGGGGNNGPRFELASR